MHHRYCSNNFLLVQEQSLAAAPSALLQLTTFLWHTGSQERARACAERVLKQAPNDVASLALLGWILTRSHHEADTHAVEPEDLDQAISLFEEALSMQPRHTEVALTIKPSCDVHTHKLVRSTTITLTNATELQQLSCTAVRPDAATDVTG